MWIVEPKPTNPLFFPYIFCKKYEGREGTKASIPKETETGRRKRTFKKLIWGRNIFFTAMTDSTLNSPKGQFGEKPEKWIKRVKSVKTYQNWSKLVKKSRRKQFEKRKKS